MKENNPTLQSLYDDDSLIPLLPLRDMVVFPSMVVPLFVGRPKSMAAINQSIAHKDSQILLFAQENPELSSPSFDDLMQTGTLGKILQRIELPDGTTKVLVEGGDRIQLKRYVEVESKDQPSFGQFEIVADQIDGEHLHLLCMSVLEGFKSYVKGNKKIPAEVIKALDGLDDPARISDIVSAQMNLSLAKRHELLAESSVKLRLESLLLELEGHTEINELEKNIRQRVKQQMEKSQREYYLNEQIKAIQHELTDLDESNDENAQLALQIEQAGMPEEIELKAKAELKKLTQMSAMSSEATVIRNYLDWLLKMPWQQQSKLKSSLPAAEKILNRDHFGLEKVKERILEYLAVQKRVGKINGSIICLAGPPGVGKTSLGKSIAEATNREFARISLGGVRDEAEIRGHRRTYIGALPGKIVQTLAKVGTKNPVILLDEIDKMSQDFRGDPSSALLEVLDPEQNNKFADHFLEVDLDLSDVLFIATANSLNIPGPLLDRMEVINLSGYTELEKTAIAEKYLYPKQLAKHGLKKTELKLDKGVYTQLIRHYTKEAGVRNLDRELANLCRKSVRALASPSVKKVTIKEKALQDYLGPIRYRYGITTQEAEIGRVNGLAWTQVGGDLLPIEAVMHHGSGKVAISGSLGEVMKESISAAMTTIRARAELLSIEPSIFTENDFHIHVPDGATPKDGPSAGIAICCALVSVLKQIGANPDVAMTGEITLSGRVLPIGGLKEKLLAAQRGGIKKVLVPADNEKDLTDIPAEVLDKIEIKVVSSIEEVLHNALESTPFDNLTTEQDYPLNVLKNSKKQLTKDIEQRH